MIMVMMLMNVLCGLDACTCVVPTARPGGRREDQVSYTLV